MVGIDTLMDVQGEGREVKRGVLRFSSAVEVPCPELLQFRERRLRCLDGSSGDCVIDAPLDLAALGIELERRVYVRVVGVRLLSSVAVGLWGHQTDRRVVGAAGFLRVLLVDRFLTGFSCVWAFLVISGGVSGYLERLSTSCTVVKFQA